MAGEGSGTGGRPDLPGIDRRLSRVERRLSEVAHALERLVPAVDTVRGLVVDELAQLQGDVRRTAALVDSFSASLNADTAALGAQIDEIRQGAAAPTMTSELEQHLDEIADRQAASIQQMSMAAAEERAQAARGLVQVLRAELASIAGPLLELQGPLADAVAPLRDVGDPAAIVREAMEVMRTTLDSAIAAQAARVEAVVGTIREQVATEAALGRQDTTDAIDRLESGVAERVDAIGSVGDDVRRAVESAAQQIVSQVDRAQALSGEGTDHVAHRMAEVEAMIEARLRAFASQSDDAIDQLRAAVSASRLPTESLSAAVDGLQAEVEASRRQAEQDRLTIAELTQRVEELTTSQQGQVERLATMLDEQRASMEEAAATDRRAFVAVSNEAAALIADTMQERLDKGEARIERAMDAISRLEATVVDHLERRERQAQGEREALTTMFAEQLLDGISRRDRRRLGRQLEERAAAAPSSRSAARTPAAAAPAQAAAPAPAPAAATPAPAPAAAPAPEPEPEPSPFAPPAEPDAPAAPSAAPPIVRKSRTAHPPAPVPAPAPPATGGSTEPAPSVRPPRNAGPRTRMSPKVSARRALTDREVLARVKGLGAARQSLLLDTFGSLDGVRAASDDELLACRGIGPALVEQLREVLGESAS